MVASLQFSVFSFQFSDFSFQCATTIGMGEDGPTYLIHRKFKGRNGQAQSRINSDG
jgi:hypothetical protein